MFVISHFQFDEEARQDTGKGDGSMEGSEDELTCSICLEQVNRGELVRSLPCLHQVHHLLTLMPLKTLWFALFLCDNMNQ